MQEKISAGFEADNEQDPRTQKNDGLNKRYPIDVLAKESHCWQQSGKIMMSHVTYAYESDHTYISFD